MPNHSQHSHEDDGRGRAAHRFDLFYYQRVGERFYLRLTPLAAGLILGLPLLSVAGLIFLFVYNFHNQVSADDVNIQIRTPPAASTPLNTIIQPPKPAPPFPRVTPPAPPSPVESKERRVSPTPQPGTTSSTPSLKTTPER
jgi:hypothetical protein